MNSQIDSIIRKTRRYWYDDGFAEILIGLLFSGISAGLYLQYQLTDNPTLLMVVIVGMMAFIFTSAIILKVGLRWLKENVTYPRTGYIKYNETPDPNARKLTLILPIIVALTVVFLPDNFNILGMAVGLIMGLFMAIIAYKTSVGRFMIAAVVSIGAGVLSAYFGLGDVISVVLVFASVGILLFITGLITLRYYLKQNPSTQDDA